MDKLQEVENEYIRRVQEKTLDLNLPPGIVPTAEEIQANSNIVTLIPKGYKLRDEFVCPITR